MRSRGVVVCLSVVNAQCEEGGEEEEREPCRHGYEDGVDEATRWDGRGDVGGWALGFVSGCCEERRGKGTYEAFEAVGAEVCHLCFLFFASLL